MTCPICKGKGSVLVYRHTTTSFPTCPHCRDWGFWRRLWEKGKGVFGR